MRNIKVSIVICFVEFRSPFYIKLYFETFDKIAIFMELIP